MRDQPRAKALVENVLRSARKAPRLDFLSSLADSCIINGLCYQALRPVALLQVASAGSALLIDLHVIAAQEGVAGMTLVGAALTETLVGGGRAETQGAQEGHGKGEASGAAAGDRRAPLLVGYVLGFDLRRLATSYRCFASLEAARCVDLRRVCRYLAKAPDAVRRARGLSGLCRATLGLPLSKRMQCSNWEARPLSREQMYYAALDAQACVAVWNTWRQMYGADCVEAACQGGGGQIRWAARERPSVLEAIGKRPRNARQEKKIAKRERLERERERKEARQRRKREAKAAAATQADAQTPRRKAHKPRGFAEGCLKSQQQENATPV